VANKPEVEVLMCSSKKAGCSALPGEILLDESDGLDWPTICKCDLIHSAKKSDLNRPHGQVSPFRRAQMIRLIIAAHGWGEILAG